MLSETATTDGWLFDTEAVQLRIATKRDQTEWRHIAAALRLTQAAVRAPRHRQVRLWLAALRCFGHARSRLNRHPDLPPPVPAQRSGRTVEEWDLALHAVTREARALSAALTAAPEVPDRQIRELLDRTVNDIAMLLRARLREDGYGAR